MLDNIPTFDDYDFDEKTVLMRLDLNSPLDPGTNEFLDDRRFRSHKPTIKEILGKKIKLVLLSHQGRPGGADFTTLEPHAKKLSDVIGHDVGYVDSLFSSYAAKRIKELDFGDVILMENTRFYSEEVLKRPPDVQATTLFVRKISPLVDVFVNDAFAVAHRSQPSVVGFPMVLPSVAGRLMENEVRTITEVLKNPKKPVTIVLGGTKADDSLKIAERTLANGETKILTGGLVANIFLAARGYRLGEPSIEFIRGKKMVEQIDVARELLNKHEDKIVLPLDLALDEEGRRVEIDTAALPKDYKISDIGKKTIRLYVDTIKRSGTIFANGALGIFENKKFAKGTEEIIKAIADSDGFSIIGGGHTVAAAHDLNVGDRVNHVSSGGGACVNLLAGYKLPAVEALRISADLFKKKK